MKIPPTMKAAVLHAPHRLELETVQTPLINDNEVLIQVKACGVCGSDILAFHGHHPRVAYPRILGHEFSGVIVQVGSSVTSVKVGDRVASEMQIKCGSCWACCHGYLNHCVTNRSIGLNVDGAMAQYVKVPAENVLLLPDNVDFEVGAVAETLAVGYNAVRLKAKVGAGDIVVIIGAGSVGMDVLLAAKASGAYVIISGALC
jgi:L-iditol 2-dehydrogenase